MELELIQCRDGLYAVDWTLVESIIRSNLYASALLRLSKEKVTEKWIGPDIYHWTVDWDSVRSEKKRAPEFTNEFRLQAQYLGMKPKIRELERMVRETRTAKGEWGRRMQAAQSKTMANINTSVSRSEIGVEVAKSVRDVSGGMLVVGATVLSGGTLAGLAGVATLGGGINAATKFQDTGSGSAAAFAFATGFTVNLIPGAGAGAKASEKVVMFVLKAKFEAFAAGGQALIEGKTAEEAVAKSLESVATGVLGAGAGKLLTTSAARKMLGNIAYPATMQITFKADTYLNRLKGTRDLTHGMIRAASGEIIKRGVEATRKPIRADAPRPRASRPILDNALIVDEVLLNRAVQGPDKSEFRRLLPV